VKIEGTRADHQVQSHRSHLAPEAVAEA